MKVSVTVKPGSKKGPFVQPSLTGELLVYVREPALEGRANRAVIEMLAEFYEIPKTRITLIRGGTTRNKVYEIPDPKE